MKKFILFFVVISGGLFAMENGYSPNGYMHPAVSPAIVYNEYGQPFATDGYGNYWPVMPVEYAMPPVSDASAQYAVPSEYPTSYSEQPIEERSVDRIKNIMSEIPQLLASSQFDSQVTIKEKFLHTLGTLTQLIKTVKNPQGQQEICTFFNAMYESIKPGKVLSVLSQDEKFTENYRTSYARLLGALYPKDEKKINNMQRAAVANKKTSKVVTKKLAPLPQYRKKISAQTIEQEEKEELDQEQKRLALEAEQARLRREEECAAQQRQEQLLKDMQEQERLRQVQAEQEQLLKEMQEQQRLALEAEQERLHREEECAAQQRQEQLLKEAQEQEIKAMQLPDIFDETSTQVDDEEDDISQLPPEVQEYFKAKEQQTKKPKKSKKNKKSKPKQVKKIMKVPTVPSVVQQVLQPVPTIVIEPPVVQDSKQEPAKPLSMHERLQQAKSLCAQEPKEGIRKLVMLLEYKDILEHKDIGYDAAYYLARLYDPLSNRKNDIVKDAGLAALYYKKAYEFKTISTDMMCNALLCCVVSDKKEDARLWMENINKDAKNDGTIYWAQAIASLTADEDYCRTAEFFKHWYQSKKNIIKPELYDFCFDIVNSWLTKHASMIHTIKNDNEVSLHAFATITYALGKMFLEGPQTWQMQGKKGWQYSLSDDKSVLQEGCVYPLHLIKFAIKTGVIAAAYYGGTSELLPDYCRIPLLQQVLRAKDNGATLVELQNVEKTLEEMAQKGNFAAIMILVQEAYERKKLSIWLNNHEHIAPKIFMTEQAVPAIHYASNECLAAMKARGEQNRNKDLLVTLSFCHQLGKFYELIRLGQKVQEIIETDLPSVANACKKIIDENKGIESFIYCLQGLGNQYLSTIAKENYDYPSKMYRHYIDAEESFRSSYKKSKDIAYFYMQFLLSDWDKLRDNKERQQLFLNLAQQLEKTDYCIYTLKARVRYYMYLGDKQQALYFIKKGEEHPVCQCDEIMAASFQTMKKLLQEKDQAAPGVPSETIKITKLQQSEEVPLTKYDEKNEYIIIKNTLVAAQNAYDKQYYVAAASLLQDAITKHQLLAYTAADDQQKKIFDNLIAKLEQHNEIAMLPEQIGRIRAMEIAYLKELDLVAIEKAKKGLATVDNLEKKIDEVKQHEHLLAPFLQTLYKNISGAQKTLRPYKKSIADNALMLKIMELLFRQRMQYKVQIQELVGLPLKSHNTSVPLNLPQEENEHKMVKNILLGAKDACNIKSYVAAAALLEMAVMQKHLLQHVERSLGKMSTLFAEIHATLKQQDDETVKKIMNNIAIYQAEYKSTLNHDEITKAKQYVRMVKKLCDRYTILLDSKENEDAALKLLLDDMLKEIPTIKATLAPDELEGKNIMKNEEFKHKLTLLFAKEIAEYGNKLNQLVGLPASDNSITIVNGIPAKPASNILFLPQGANIEQVLSKILTYNRG